MAGRIISVINCKGGVGKTTVAVNVAACLAKDEADYSFGKRVLLVDLDPQSHASLWTMGSLPWKHEINAADNEDRTAYSLFKGILDVKDRAFQKVYATQGPHYLRAFFLLPANYHLDTLEDWIFRDQINRRMYDNYSPGDEYLYLAGYADALRDQFEYVIIDCPPNLYKITLNALFHSDYVIIPCTPDHLSIMGLKQLLRRLNKVCCEMHSILGGSPTVLGIPITRRKKAKYSQTRVDQLEGELKIFRRDHEDSPIIHAKTSVLGDASIYENPIHSDAFKNFQPTVLYKPKTEAAAQFKELTQSILTAMENIER